MFDITFTINDCASSARTNLSQQQIEAQCFSKLIILIHGFPDTSKTFTELWPILASQYPEALIAAPTLRGYERSSVRGPNDYCMYEVASDMKEWIIQLTGNRQIDVHLVGHDWGAIVAYKTASMYPQLIKSMATMAIPYLTNLSILWLLWNYPFVFFHQLWCLSYMLTMQAKALYLKRFQNSYLLDLWKHWSPSWNFTQRQLATVESTFQDEAILDAATAYYRCLISWKNRKHTRWYVNFDKVPTLVMGAVEDGCMVAPLFEVEHELLKDRKNVKIEMIKDAGHFMHREQPEVVASCIISWFNSH